MFLFFLFLSFFEIISRIVEKSKKHGQLSLSIYERCYGDRKEMWFHSNERYGISIIPPLYELLCFSSLGIETNIKNMSQDIYQKQQQSNELNNNKITNNPK